MTIEEIKLRWLVNQYLTDPAEKLTVVRDLCGIQCQFLSNAVHSLKLRCSDFDEATLKDGLVKNWTIRGTVHVFAESDLPVFLSGENHRRNVWDTPSFWNQRPDWGLTPERQVYFSTVILDALKDGPLTRENLKIICRDAGMTEGEAGSMFDPWGGGIRELCERGFLNYTVQEEKAFCLSPDFTPLPAAEAELELARRYFTNFGPATIHDAQYFFHTSAAQVKSWLSQLPVERCECEGNTYFYIKNGKNYTQNIPDCLFLAGFDQLMLGYEKKESLFLKPDHLRGIFNLAGIVMPPILLRGQVVGKWKKKDRKLTLELFEPLPPGDKALIQNTADALWQDIRKLEWK